MDMGLGRDATARAGSAKGADALALSQRVGR
jgi:hypothetical protein